MLYHRWKKSRGYIDAGKLLDVVENTRLEKLNAKINHVRIHSGGIKYRLLYIDREYVLNTDSIQYIEMETVENTRLEKLNAKINHVRPHTSLLLITFEPRVQRYEIRMSKESQPQNQPFSSPRIERQNKFNSKISRIRPRNSSIETDSTPK